VKLGYISYVGLQTEKKPYTKAARRFYRKTTKNNKEETKKQRKRKEKMNTAIWLRRR
jgi:hypothetical protein